MEVDQKSKTHPWMSNIFQSRSLIFYMEVDIDLSWIMGLKHPQSLLCIRAYLTKNTGGPVSGRSFSYNGHFHIVEHFEVTV